MRAAVRLALVGALLVAAGCAAPPAPDGQNGAETAAIPGEPMPHENARFLVRRGDEDYRVNVRYVDMIDESVMAVRRGRGEADQSWRTFEIPASGRTPTGLPFGAEAWRPVAIEICEAVRREAKICPGGAQMQLVRKRDGSMRTMYRDKRQAWVVFAACPAPGAG